jgi:hypothetical protein
MRGESITTVARRIIPSLRLAQDKALQGGWGGKPPEGMHSGWGIGPM